MEMKWFYCMRNANVCLLNHYYNNCCANRCKIVGVYYAELTKTLRYHYQWECLCFSTFASR
jgi:hypothetical protein